MYFVVERSTHLSTTIFYRLLVTLGSALGGLIRYALTRWTIALNTQFPWTTLTVNIIGSWFIAFLGTLTLTTGPFSASESRRPLAGEFGIHHVLVMQSANV